MYFKDTFQVAVIEFRCILAKLAARQRQSKCNKDDNALKSISDLDSSFKMPPDYIKLL